MHEDQLYTRLKQIKLIATDVDGVLTDGTLYINDSMGEPFNRFSIQDGMAVYLANLIDVKIAVISGRGSLVSEARCKRLGLEMVYTGVEHKGEKLKEIIAELNIQPHEAMFIGDDLIDLPAMKLTGFNVVPADAQKAVKYYADYIANTPGGGGILREVVDMLIESRGMYEQIINKFLE